MMIFYFGSIETSAKHAGSSCAVKTGWDLSLFGFWTSEGSVVSAVHFIVLNSEGLRVKDLRLNDDR